MTRALLLSTLSQIEDFATDRRSLKWIRFFSDTEGESAMLNAYNIKQVHWVECAL